MVHSPSRSGPWRRVIGIRTLWRPIDDGEFSCPGCGGDRNYQRLAGRRRLAVLGVPLLDRGDAEPVVACASCRGRFPLTALGPPTTTRLAALLRDGLHTIALTMLSAGGSQAPLVRETAVHTLRGAGYPDCTEEQLMTLLAALGGEGSAALELELWEALAPLAPHLAAAGREGLLLRGAHIALADGPYSGAEHEALLGIGDALGLCSTNTSQLLAAARTPS